MICACGHLAVTHHHGKSCTALLSDGGFKFCKCMLFREARSIARQLNDEEETTIMAKQGKKLVLFEVTSKKADELLAKDNQANAAIFYRVLVAKEAPMKREAIYEASKSKCESAAAWERLGNQTHDTLARLRKAGFVKRIETREAVVEKTKKPKSARKPRAAKKSKANGAEKHDVSEKDIPQNEATA